MREQRNVGNPRFVTDRKREGIRFTLVWQGTHHQRWLPWNNVTPAITTRVFSLLHGQTRPHDVLGWAEELQSALIWVFSMIQPGQCLTMTSTWTLKFVSFFSSRKTYRTFMWAVGSSAFFLIDFFFFFSLKNTKGKLYMSCRYKTAHRVRCDHFKKWASKAQLHWNNAG